MGDPTRNPDRRPAALRSSNRGPVAALLGVLLIAGLMFWVVSAIQARNAVQNCIDSGRKDCVELK